MKLPLFGKNKDVQKETSNEQEHNIQQVSYSIIENTFEKGEFLESAVMLSALLEFYGEKKKKDHRYKGREFIHFILSAKHKDLKNVGYTHWVNIGKIIHSSKKAVYPYHQENLKHALEFFKKEIKSLNNIKTYIKH